MKAHHLALSSLITLSFFLAILPPSYCTDDAHFVDCSRPYECGRIKNVSYPFWGVNRPEYCGRQGFKLECYYDEYPIIKFEELVFSVLHINQPQNIMTIARWDLWHGLCPHIYNDTVLNYNIFDYASTVLNITLFYNCTPQVNTSIPDQNRFSCGLWEGSVANNNAYFVNESLPKIHIREPGKCRGRIRVPISRNAIIDESAVVVHELQGVLNQGFDVDYYPLHDTACNGCVESGGNCGSNETHQFVCFCRDGERSHYCTGREANNNAYFVNESSAKIHVLEPEKCRGNISVPILRNAIDESAGVVHALYEELIQGFEVDYDASRDACSECEHSGGHCGSNVTHQFVCFCPDGERSYNCPGTSESIESRV